MNRKKLVMATLLAFTLTTSTFSATNVYAQENSTKQITDETTTDTIIAEETKAPVSDRNTGDTSTENDKTTAEDKNEYGINLLKEQNVASVNGVDYVTLEEAVKNANGQEIQLLTNITLTTPITITKDTVINGANGENNFQINGDSWRSYRTGLFHMHNEEDTATKLTLKNIDLINKNGSAPCGVSIRASNQMLNLNNVNIDTSYYSLFIGVPSSENDDVNDVVVNVENSKLTGYSAVYYRTNSTTNMIMRPILNVNNSELYGRGYNGYGNGFSTIVYNGTRNARTVITNSILSNSFDTENAEANEAIIQFNSYGAYEENAEVKISNSTVKTKSTTAAPNLIKYTANENLNMGNKVIIDSLTVLVDETNSDLLRIIRNGNELVATGKTLEQILSVSVPNYGDKPGTNLPNEGSTSLITSGDIVIVPIDTTLTENVNIPENVTIHISEGATLDISGKTLTGLKGSRLVVDGNIKGIDGISGKGTYEWQEDTGIWSVLASGITLDKENHTMTKGETLQLNATVIPQNAVNKEITWTSSNNGVVTVDENGKISAVGCGESTITVTIKDTELTAQCKIIVSHHFDEKWSSNETSHWHDCKNCDDKMGETNHTFKWVVDKEATHTEKGLKHEECSVCGYKKASVEIPVVTPSNPEKPSTDKPNNDKGSVETGDQTNVGLFTSMFAMSALGIAVLAVLKKKKALENK